jgi:recombinational DNA repair protein (RecF pathway)
MPAGTFRCLVLGREPSGESHLLLSLLEPEAGVHPCLIRANRRGDGRPDLFDEAEVTLERARGGANRFVRDYRVLRRRTGIGRDTQALERASRLGNLVRRNPPPPESAPVAYRIVDETLAAMADRPRPDAAYLKALWLLLKDGGWPVEADWLGRLGTRASQAAAVLASPLDAQSVDPATVAALSQDLERWAAGEVHYVLP